MTLQRLTREQPTSSGAPVRAKALSHERLRSAARSVIADDRALELPFGPPPPASADAIATDASQAPRAPRLSSHTVGRERELALVAELARVLASTLDYTSALRDVVRVVAERLQCGCVIDLLGPQAPLQISHLSERADNHDLTTNLTLAPLVADVVTRRRIAAAASTERSLEGRRARAVAEQARIESGAPWIVCAPLVAGAGEPYGALTIFGGGTQTEVPQELAREVAERIALAIRNGRLYSAAVDASRGRQRVLSLVAHELKNPLGVILMGAVQSLEPRPDGETCSCRRRELEAIYRSAKRMKHLVGDLLDLASIDAGKLSVKPAVCDVSQVIWSSIRDVASMAKAAGVDLIDDQLPALPAAYVDADRLGQVLVNLITNATKFTPRGGRVRVRCAPVDKTEIVVAVEDSGRGIPPENLGRIFEHFWQAADTAELGSGLGLAICKSIVELSGGRIWAQSTVGVGTTVYFTLPTTTPA
jgi:signal transduction histidine kinase